MVPRNKDTEAGGGRDKAQPGTTGLGSSSILEEGHGLRLGQSIDWR